MFKPLQMIKVVLLSKQKNRESTVAPHSRFYHLPKDRFHRNCDELFSSQLQITTQFAPNREVGKFQSPALKEFPDDVVEVDTAVDTQQYISR